MRFIIFVLLLSHSAFLLAEEPKTKPVPLFNGKDLAGWHAKPGGTWTVEDGAIVGRSLKSERRHGILLSDKTYGDFVLTLEFQVLAGNSGFYFRSEKVNSAVSVNGFQVEVDRTPATGGLYETGGRAWVVNDQKAKDIYKPGEWTKLELRCQGRDVEVKINGVVTSQLTNDSGRREGHFGLQLHGGQDMHVLFRKIKVTEIKGE